jgi:hypothetical protein
VRSLCLVSSRHTGCSVCCLTWDEWFKPCSSKRDQLWGNWNDVERHGRKSNVREPPGPRTCLPSSNFTLPKNVPGGSSGLSWFRKQLHPFATPGFRFNAVQEGLIPITFIRRVNSLKRGFRSPAFPGAVRPFPEEPYDATHIGVDRIFDRAVIAVMNGSASSSGSSQLNHARMPASHLHPDLRACRPVVWAWRALHRHGRHAPASRRAAAPRNSIRRSRCTDGH